MPREPVLFNTTNGNVIDAFLLLRETGANVSPQWIENAKISRKKTEAEIAKLLQKNSLDVLNKIKSWYICYQKESFYRGIRVLLDLERKGKSNI